MPPDLTNHLYIFDWEISRMMGRCSERSYSFNPWI